MIRVFDCLKHEKRLKMGIQVGRWDCRHCGHKGNLGPETKCASCGAPRDPDIQFYLPEDADYVQDEAELERAGQGADWNCDHCGADNKASAARCRSCGNPRTGDDSTRQEKEYDPGAVPRSAAEAEGKLPPVPPKPAKARGGRTKTYGCLIVGLVLIGILAFIFWPRSTTVEVAGHVWERTLEIQNYRPVQEEGWDVPAGGKRLRSFRAVHHYDQVLDHYENRTRTVKVKVGTERYKCGKKDMGNGYFKDKYCTRPKYENRKENYQEAVYRKEPVYRTKYAFEIHRWTKDRINRAEGLAKPAKWPQGPPEGKNWREGEKTETYYLIVVDKKGKKHQEKTDYKTWEKYNIGDKIEASTNLAGAITLKTGK